jgi:hypothetical protein
MPTINDLESITTPEESSVVVVTDLVASKKITISDLRNTMVKIASPTVAGAIKIGAGLAIDAAGVVSVPSITGYTLPTASNTTLGGVIVGSGLAVNGQGVVSVSLPPPPVASEYTFGTVKIGTGLNIVDGVLSNPVTQYTLPSATQEILGGIKVGSGLTINNSSLSVTAKSYAVEGNQIIEEDYTISTGKTVYSVGPISIGRTNTVTVERDSTWTIYTPGATENYIEEAPASSLVINEQPTVITSSYTIKDGVNATSFGPITIERNATVEVSPLSTWIIF